MGEEYISAKEYWQFLNWCKARVAEGWNVDDCTYDKYLEELKIIFEK